VRSPSWSALRLLAGAAVLGAVLWRTGTGPFVDGVRALDVQTLALGAAIAVPTTVAGAWRWHLVARGLGVGVDLGPAVAGCYRAQFLNATLPGGVLGDVHRGVRHGRQAGDAGRGLRAVGWERLAGQLVQAGVAVVVLLLFPSPVRSWAPAGLAVLLGVTVGALGVALLARRRGRHPSGSLPARVFRAAREDVRCGLLAPRAWPGVLLGSLVAVAGHVATYVVAARAVGVATPLAALLPLVLLVLLAAGLPMNVAGWGPREGMAAWAFGAAGIGAAAGVATAVAYGAMVVVASLPGAVVLLVARGVRSPGREPVVGGGLAGG
jgi:glycosyltransferase 2 family protein